MNKIIFLLPFYFCLSIGMNWALAANGQTANTKTTTVTFQISLTAPACKVKVIENGGVGANKVLLATLDGTEESNKKSAKVPVFFDVSGCDNITQTQIRVGISRGNYVFKNRNGDRNTIRIESSDPNGWVNIYSAKGNLINGSRAVGDIDLENTQTFNRQGNQIQNISRMLVCMAQSEYNNASISKGSFSTSAKFDVFYL